MLIVSTKIPERVGSTRYPDFMGICATISHKCQPYVHGRLVGLLVPGLAERKKEVG